MPANLENSAVATGLGKSVFIPIPKKGNTKECSNYRTIALISHASKVMLNVNHELPDVQAGFRNSSIRIPSPPLALFIVILPKVHLTSHSRMSGSR